MTRSTLDTDLSWGESTLNKHCNLDTKQAHIEEADRRPAQQDKVLQLRYTLHMTTKYGLLSTARPARGVFGKVLNAFLLRRRSEDHTGP